MLHGPSTAYSYRPKKRPTRRIRSIRALPTVFTCENCGHYVVGIYSPASRKRVVIPARALFLEMALVYSFKRHGPTHFCGLRARYRAKKAQ